MSIVYFDICSIPVFLIILYICYARRMTKGNANRLFIAVVFVSLFSAAADLGMEAMNNAAPLTERGYVVCVVSTYIYMILRNANNVLLLLFLLALTRTTFLLRKTWKKVGFFLPYACILGMLAQNPFTGSAFTVTREAGYTRGPLMLAFYGIALIYGFVGFLYCIYCRRYLPANKWGPLLAVYVLAHLAVLIQFLRPGLLLEMFSTALGELLILLAILRPEERMDSEVGMLSWASYQSDIHSIVLSGERVQIIVIRMRNSLEIRNYLGDHSYNSFLMEVAGEIRGIPLRRGQSLEVYHERPGSIYLIAETGESGAKDDSERMLDAAREKIRNCERAGARFDPQICLIRCPEDLCSAEDIISLGHKFQKIDNRTQSVFYAGNITKSRTFAVEMHIEEILDRAVKDGNIEMYYQPIYDVRSGTFRSAEALARIVDPEYGVISPAIFIPAAETLGYIIPIGDRVLGRVFRFISEHDLDALGLAYIEVNLSVAQCMESALPDKIGALQKTYRIDPGRINLEITETTFENINEIMVENVSRLIEMGYSFALDDYGIGYSSIQRVNSIPLSLIKIDKSMLDEVSSVNGRMILEHTVHMMQSIGKRLVAEGAETGDEVDLLRGMNCDYIQGFYFSRPLPEDEFIRFLREHRIRECGTG